MADVDNLATETNKRAATEHLSSVKEAYLQQLAQETGLSYAQLTLPANLVGLLSTGGVAQRASVPTPIGWVPALLALISLLTMYFCRTH